MPETPFRSIEDLDIPELIDAAAAHDKTNGIEAPDPADVDARDERLSVQLQDALDALEKFHSDSAERRIFRLAETLGFGNAPEDDDDLSELVREGKPNGQIVLALSVDAARVLWDVLVERRQDNGPLDAIFAELSRQLEERP